jgi:threonine dehydratase
MTVLKALELMRRFFKETPLEHSQALSKAYNANLYLKREDLSPVRSYKIRGALNKMSSLESHVEDVVTCSAGNHAQGVAYACNKLGINADIYMPKITTKQKVDKVKAFGGDRVKIFLEGDTLADSFEAAMQSHKPFVHPFDDARVIEGQATVGAEILNEIANPDYIILPVGGGGLAAGVSSYVKENSPNTKIVAVEPTGAASLTAAIAEGKPITLKDINTFVDGASVSRIGALNFPLCRDNIHRVMRVDEGHTCSKILQMYNESGYIIEPAGVLSLCALDLMKHLLHNKTVVCVISGGNSDVFRMPEILERSLVYEGRKHYFRLELPQQAGALKQFITSVLGPDDDIIYFRYTKLINKETGPIILGIETKNVSDSAILMLQMQNAQIKFKKLCVSEI